MSRFDHLFRWYCAVHKCNNTHYEDGLCYTHWNLYQIGEQIAVTKHESASTSDTKLTFISDSTKGKGD